MNPALVSLLVAVQRCADDLAGDPSKARMTLSMMIEDVYQSRELPSWFMAFIDLAEALIRDQEGPS